MTFRWTNNSLRATLSEPGRSFQDGCSERRYFGADPSDRSTLRTVLRETPIDFAIEQMDLP